MLGKMGGFFGLISQNFPVVSQSSSGVWMACGKRQRFLSPPVHNRRVFSSTLKESASSKVHSRAL